MEEVVPSVQCVETSAGQSHRQAQEHNWLSLWHLLSLDAPTVAAVWTWFVAEATRASLPAVVPAAMFVAVWMLYAGDRLLDGVTGNEAMEERHRFHHRHRYGFAVALVVATGALVPLVVAIPWGILKLYLELAGPLFLWFAIVHSIAPARGLQLPKELIPGAFWAAAMFAPVWHGNGFQHGELAIAALCFGLLVTLNCWTIFAWEHQDVGQAHSSTQLGVRWLREATIAGIAMPLVATLFAGPLLTPIFCAIALAAALLWMLDRSRASLQPTHLRAAADLVLLTPLVLVAALR